MRAGRRVLATALLALSLSACATFPDNGPRPWEEQLEGAGELGGIPRVPQDTPPTGEPSEQSGDASVPAQPDPCDDPDPAVVETCLDPVGAIAAFPDGISALVAERATGRVLRVERDTEPELVTTVPVDASGGGGLTGLVLSPTYAEDGLVYAYATTPEDNRVLLLAPGEAPKPVLTGIPRGTADNGGALAVDVDGSLLVATGAAGTGDDPASLAGKLLRIDTRGRPAEGNPDPASPVLSSGLTAPGGICVNPATEAAWVTDRTPAADLLHLVVPGPLAVPAWRWPDRPGVGGCAAPNGRVGVSLTDARSLFVLEVSRENLVTETPPPLLVDEYGRLSAASLAPDGSVWLGTVNREPGGEPGTTDDRVLRIEFLQAGGANAA